MCAGSDEYSTQPLVGAIWLCYIFPWLQQNAFPSVHVIISTFIGLIFAKQIPELKWLFWIGIVLVFLATFLTKQHFIADSIAGLIIGIFGYRIWFEKVKIKPEG
ncbi:MAG: hypothetical protein Ct9H300mP29_2230 [Candidatus Neomarinimicrobiota bacterium]|nr:MAG: hypothetical protein Ct9H300mP29_2230 [Candidatus Neomarinimicrobiota bacterium]